MRTLKKSLCLLLALVFVLGLCTVGAGAATLSDANKIGDVYKNAVTVMNGLGIIEGYPDGTFQPTKNVTRAEAAKIVTYMVLGAKMAEKLPEGDGGFSDVAGNWASKYINFCASRGYIKGMGDGTFNPSGNVTGTQLFALLLRAAGYGVMGEYEGKGWDVYAFQDAATYGIIGDAETEEFSAAATREETVLYFFNTLTAVGLVGYDVDKNYYDNETYLVSGTSYNETFAHKVWDLGQTSSTNPVVIEENQATGADYTIDSNGRKYLYETGKDLIGHQAKVYYRNVAKLDNDGNTYYEAFLVEDLSSVIKGSALGSYYGDAYLALYKASKKNQFVNLSEVKYYENGVYTATADTKVTISDPADTSVNSNLIGDMKDRFTTRHPFSGNFILDKDGKVIAYTSEKLTVAQVKSVSSDGVTLKACAYGTGPFDLENAYEGIAKNDYVTVRKFGDKVTLEPTTTATILLTDKSSLVGIAGWEAFWSLNGFFGYSASSAFGAVTVPDSVGTNFNVGDTLELYLDSEGKYFDVVKKASGTNAGVVFVNYYFVKSSSDAYGKKTNSVYAQCINDAGEEVIYRLSATDGTTAGNFSSASAAEAYAAGLTKGARSVTVSDGLATLSSDAKTSAVLTKTYNLNSYLRKKSGSTYSGVYFINSDTAVYYVSKTGADMKISKVSKLENKSGDYDVYASFVENNGNYDVKAIWVLGTHTEVADTYMFIAGYDQFVNTFGAMWAAGFDFAQKGGTVDVNGVPVNYYNVYIDGTQTYSVKLKVDGDYVGTTTLFAGSPYEYTFDRAKSGFYKYSIDEDGLYALDATGINVQKVTLQKGDIRDGKLYKNADGVSLANVKIVNISSDMGAQAKTKDGNSYLTIESADDIASLLAEGYTIDVTYVYKLSSGSRVPVSVIYVTGADASGVAG